MKYNLNIIVPTLLLSVVTACSTDSMSEYERTKASFQDLINGNISSLQTWKTAVTIKANVTTNEPVKIWLMSGNDKGMLYDYKQVQASSTVDFHAPQGKTDKVYLVGVCNYKKQVTELELNGKGVQNVSLDFTADEVAQTELPSAARREVSASPRATTSSVNSSLYGSSVAGNSELYQFTVDQKNEAVQVMGSYYFESVPAKTLRLNCDYELESKGDFRITWFAGNCMSMSPHTLGYYYHSPGTYDDIQYVDLSETEIYDYIDGHPKVQYMVNEQAAREYGVEANHWYDANFDMGDTFENPNPYLWTRSGDDAYNSMAVFNRYGSNITALRGISFMLKVPAGKHVGFYVRTEDQNMPEQYDRLARIGIKPYTSRDKFKAMNFSCEAMNMNINGTYRSSIVSTPHAHWLGMENDYTGGDLDCNDVLFEVSADLEIYTPSVVEPNLEPFGGYDNCMPWTLAFEDVYRDADYDFNDAVVKLQPDYEKETCNVTVMAAGSPAKMYLHYVGPDGDVCLGEMHELLGGGDYINTQQAVAQTPFVNVGTVKWPNTYNMKKDAGRFYVEVKRGTCKDCSDILSLADTDGQMPEALLVAGEWKWPMEGVSITKAYPQFGKWAKDNTATDWWKWYQNAENNTAVSY